MPYFKDLFRDLALRSQSSQTGDKKIDKVTFLEYCSLPGIISDRLFSMFTDVDNTYINENSFISNFIKIFISNIETKMRLTFNM